MIRLHRIYTKTGDDGTTGLVDGSRLPKDHARIESYGTVDELNAVLGLARQHTGRVEGIDAVLARIQNDLFDLGADLATPGTEQGLRIVAAQVTWLEQTIDHWNQDLAALESFVLPGGSELSAWLHLARTVCRRGERATVALAALDALNAQVVPYLNRLSDLLFVLGRVANDGGATDVLWVPGKHREDS